MPSLRRQQTPRPRAALLAVAAAAFLLLLPAATAADTATAAAALQAPRAGAAARRLQAVTRQAPGPKLSNWNLDHSTTPAVYAAVETVEDVIAVVADPKAYPSPLLPVARRHSVTRCNVNDEGTVVDLSKLNRILGVERGGRAVRVQGGTLLTDIHEWLGQRGLELSFVPEIADASVGSLVASTSKDSSLTGPGYLAALVEEATYIDENARRVTVRADGGGAGERALAALTGSYGTLGIVVEVLLAVQPARVIRTVPLWVRIGPETPAGHLDFAQRLLKLKEEAANAMALIVPGDGIAYVEQRFEVADQDYARAQEAGLHAKAGTATVAAVKCLCFKAGNMLPKPWPALLEAVTPVLVPMFTAYHYRRALANSYPAVQSDEERLDFSYYEHRNYTNFAATAARALDFIAAYKKQHGFAPNALAVYFVHRTGRPAGSNYAGAPKGVSFMLDPIYSDPSDARWATFLGAFNAFNSGLGATFSLTQTKNAPPADVPPIDAAVAKPRFTTAYFRQYVAKA